MSAAARDRHLVHNEAQRAYFESREKATMRPADTPYVRRHVNEALAVAEAHAGERVIEVGCGMGRHTMLLARRGFQLEGLDLSEVLLQRLRAAGGAGLPLHQGDVLDPPSGLRGRFDLVLGFFMLHHVDDLEGCFAGVASLLRSGGRAVFLEPNPLNPLYYVQIAITPGMTWAGDKGLVRMRPGPLSRAMRAAGLAAREPVRFGFLPPFLANRSWAPRVEHALESVALWQACLPFQVFRADRS
jgi:2-polyprenyl-3-methyl-5-hydroxy-6-metoxy-1,4-benzoquinol methylase